MGRALQVVEGDEIEFTVHASGDVSVRGWTSIPTDQRWYWTEEWQQGEREASEEVAAGRTEVFESAEELFAHLDEFAER